MDFIDWFGPEDQSSRKGVTPQHTQLPQRPHADTLTMDQMRMMSRKFSDGKKKINR